MTTYTPPGVNDRPTKRKHRGLSQEALPNQLAREIMSEIEDPPLETQRAVLEGELSAGRPVSPDWLRAVLEESAANGKAASSTAPTAAREKAGLMVRNLEVVSARELFATPAEPVKGLWGRWMVRGEGTALSARAKRGKTTLVRNMMALAAMGGRFLGEEFDGPLRWVYFTREGSPSFFRHKLAKVTDALGLDEEALERIYVVERGGDVGLRLSRPADVDAARRVLDGLKSGPGLDVVTFDPFARFSEGNENAVEDISKAVDAILGLTTEFEVAAVVPHHMSQSGTGLDASRGSTYFVDAMATVFNLDTTDDGPRTRRKLSPVGVRYQEHLEDTRKRYLAFDVETETYTETDGGVVDDLVEQLSDGEWHAVNKLATDAGVPRTTMQDRVKAAGARMETDHGGPNGAARVRRAEGLIDLA
jgi:AAA domain